MVDYLSLASLVAPSAIPPKASQVHVERVNQIGSRMVLDDVRRLYVNFFYYHEYFLTSCTLSI
jgi:hypothetical protein